MTRSELHDSFSAHEVETAETLLKCSAGPPTADKFRRLLLLMLRGHYSSAENYMGFDHLACYTWHPDDKQTRLTIEFTHTGRDNRPDAYPGIYVAFSKVEFAKSGISGNFAGHTQDTAGTYVSKLATASYTILHVSKNASDAYDLAELTSRVLIAMAKPLALSSGATEFEVLGYEQPKEKNPSPENYYQVAMNVQISYTQALIRSLESHRIRRIVQLITPQQ